MTCHGLTEKREKVIIFTLMYSRPHYYANCVIWFKHILLIEEKGLVRLQTQQEPSPNFCYLKVISKPSF